jgi:hypothetical protein
VALARFLLSVNFLSWLGWFGQEEATTPSLTKDQELLSKMRDLLKQGQA